MITYPLNNINYMAEDAELFHCTRTSGIWAEDSFSISLTGADNNVTIGTGIAWINNEEFSGKVSALKSAKTINLGIADGVYPRIDVIAIQYSANNNATDVIVKKGTPATNPVRPAIVRTGAVYELYIASVYRPAGATAITASNVTDLRMDKTVCGLMADSVTKIDMDAIRAQFMGLVEELEEAIQNIEVGEIVPVEKGGTGVATLAEARQNINFIGVNPSINRDTPKAWARLGTGVAHVGSNALLPTENGFLFNAVTDDYINQTWIDIVGGIPIIWRRNGNIERDWNCNWIEETSIELLWENASPISRFPAQTISLNLGGYDFVEILFQFSTGLTTYGIIQSVKVPIGNNIYVNGMFSGKFTKRQAQINTDGVTFENGGILDSYGSAAITDNDGVLVPYKIIGIKGVR